MKRNLKASLRNLKKGGIQFFLTVVLMPALSGCQLARPDLQKEAQPDRLIGMYITQEYVDLFDFDRYLNDHIGRLASGKNLAVDGAESRKYENRLYAVCQEKDSGITEYVFEGLEGIRFFAPGQAGDEDGVFAAQADEEVADVRLNVSDQGQEMEGTIYCSANEYARFYCNPVYQTADGQVYLLSGTGISGNLTDGASFSQSLEEKRTVNENGEEMEERFYVSVSICGQDAYSRHVVAWMDAQDQKLEETVYSAEEVPDSITAPAGAAYLICTSYQDGEGGTERVGRQLAELSDHTGELCLFVPGERGLPVQKRILLEALKE